MSALGSGADICSATVMSALHPKATVKADVRNGSWFIRFVTLAKKQFYSVSGCFYRNCGTSTSVPRCDRGSPRGRTERRSSRRVPQLRGDCRFSQLCSTSAGESIQREDD